MNNPIFKKVRATKYFPKQEIEIVIKHRKQKNTLKITGQLEK